MFGKNLVFYVVASTIIAVVAFALGGGTVVAILASLVGPPVLLLALRLIR
ncbi:MAG: hypothetical protein AAB528_05975 [Chloroflexota bacterium]